MQPCEFVWSREKQVPWLCCSVGGPPSLDGLVVEQVCVEGLACPTTSDTTTIRPLPFDCVLGPGGSTEGWEAEKRTFCCHYSLRGCPTQTSTTTTGSSTTPTTTTTTAMPTIMVPFPVCNPDDKDCTTLYPTPLPLLSTTTQIAIVAEPAGGAQDAMMPSGGGGGGYGYDAQASAAAGYESQTAVAPANPAAGGYGVQASQESQTAAAYADPSAPNEVAGQPYPMPSPELSYPSPAPVRRLHASR